MAFRSPARGRPERSERSSRLRGRNPPQSSLAGPHRAPSPPHRCQRQPPSVPLSSRRCPPTRTAPLGTTCVTPRPGGPPATALLWNEDTVVPVGVWTPSRTPTGKETIALALSCKLLATVNV